MRRFYGFLLGLVIGGTSVYVAYQYHLVRTPDRLLVVPKVQPSLIDLYADIRKWQLEDWKKHSALARHLIASGHTNLITQTATDNVVDEYLDGLQKGRKTSSPRAGRDTFPR